MLTRAMDSPETTDAIVRPGFFLSVFVALALLETVFPRRRRDIRRANRWVSNIRILALNQVVLRFLLPISAIALAVYAEQRQWGLFGQLSWPAAAEIALAVLILDLVIYFQHRIYHLIHVLWRFHRVHHADTEFDVTTGIRLHPVSVLLSGFIKLGAVAVLGAAPIAVLLFEVLLNATSLFNHSNLRIPEGAGQDPALVRADPFDDVIRFAIAGDHLRLVVADRALCLHPDR